jgi:hypothetical protein
MKTRLLLALFAGAMLALPAAAAPGLAADAQLDPAVPAPAEVLGFEPGERHPRHDQVLRYFEALAATSDRVRIEVIGETHGGRPLLLAYFSRPDRLRDLDALRAARRSASREGAGPPVIWLGYSVHGNEASATSAALVVAWHLAATQSQEVRAWLDEMVIVMEPALNPDGLDRFAHWVNAHRGRHPSADPLDREHNEAWPNGRTNYYWFDLNRDWLPLSQPESRARLRHYNAWRPHVVTDVHEMWETMTYFFQPGVPERNHPLIPAGNLDLTHRIAERHGEILDAAGEPLFTREVFDDYYVGKGSTYPDVTGGVGILFEQGTSRGHRIDTPFGERTFHDAIANQVRTSISTLRGSHALAAELLAYQAGFYRDSAAQARRAGHAGWLLGDGGDPARARALLELLLGHDIEVRPVSAEVGIEGRRYPPGSAWFIPAAQDRYLLLRSIFEVSDAPAADAFYDVSAWPLQHAFRLPLAEVRRAPAIGAALAAVPAYSPPPLPGGTPAAWLVPWAQLNAPAVLGALLAEGYRVQVATEPLTASTTAGPRELGRGTLIIHPGIQDAGLPPVGERLRVLSAEHGVEIVAASRGLSLAGIDLGGPAAPMLKAPKVALLVGDHLDPYTAGDTWHWFDTRLKQPLTQLDWLRLPAELRGYTHVVLPDGDYAKLPPFVGERLVAFVKGGGQLIALRRAATWLESLPLDWEFADAVPGGEPGVDPAGQPGEGAAVVRRPYGEFGADHARAQVGGSVLRVALDVTHPLGFGYEAGELNVMRSGWHRLRPVRNPYAQPATYLDPPLVAGYLSPQNRARLAGSPSLVATRHGPGLVLRMADDPLFRGYWRGTEMLFANALFFGSVIGETLLPALEPDPTHGGR